MFAAEDCEDGWVESVSEYERLRYSAVIQPSNAMRQVRWLNASIMETAAITLEPERDAAGLAGED